MAHLDRRQFLVGTGLGTAGLAALGEPSARAIAASAPPRLDDWRAVREQFPLTPDLLHFSTFFFVSHPKPVREAIERFRQQLDADPYSMVEKYSLTKSEANLDLRVKRAAADYLGGKADDIALTSSTTQGLALVYHGLVLAPGQEILLTEHDHFSHHESARLAALRCSASVRKFKLFERLEVLPKVTAEQLVAAIRAAIQPNTRVLGITWVHSESGLKLPLRAIATAVAELNGKRAERDRVLVVVDGVHGFGVEDEPAATTGVDAFVTGTHKWIFGPRGTGLVWARDSLWAQMRPSIPSFDSRDGYDAWLQHKPAPGPAKAGWFSPGGFRAYEHGWAVADAFAFHAAIGRPRIAARIHELNGLLKEGLASMPHIKLFTPAGDALSSGLVAFDVDGVDPEAVVEKLLAKKIVASTSPYSRTVARLAAGIMNSPAEVDTVLAAVRGLKA
jgi:selenocysteine lyase/cysteine desulfurase